MYGDIEIKHRSHYNEEVVQIRKDFASALKTNIESRFPSDSCSIVDAFEVLSLRGLRDGEVSSYGCEKMDTLLEHYGEE